MNKKSTAVPATIELFGAASTVFAQAEVLVRQGFSFCSNRPPHVFPHNGHATITMIPFDSNVDPLIQAAATEAVEIALAQQKFHDETATANELKSTAEHQQKVDEKARLAVEVKAAQAVLKALQQSHASITI